VSSVSQFTLSCQNVASDFLASVIVVDDRARLSPGPEIATPTILKVPGRQARAVVDNVLNPLPEEGAHGLDAKSLIDQFATMGMVCGVLRPDKEDVENFQTKFAVAIERADVVILDWVLHDYKNGECTLEIIENLHKSAKKGAGRTRLIVIYTGEPDLGKIVDDVKRTLGVTDAGSPYTVQASPLYICVYAKQEGGLSGRSAARQIAAGDLSKTVISEFSTMTGGLISNVALKSLAALRANTHQLLRKFDRSLDGPYVTHRTLLLPEEASEHIVPLIVAEIQSILEDANVNKIADGASVSKWLKHKLADGSKITLDGVSKDAVDRGMTYLLGHGVGHDSEIFARHPGFSKQLLRSNGKAVEELKKRLTQILSPDSQDAERLDQDLAILMSVRSRYSSPPPVLRLGTIVQEIKGSSSRYLFCMQPVCDSVRLKVERAFPFLPLKSVVNQTSCDFVISDQLNRIRLALNYRPFEVSMVTFKPSGKHREIVAKRSRTGRFFKASGSNAGKYRWVADLKPEHAQDVANRFAQKVSRVGLTVSEWARPREGGSD